MSRCSPVSRSFFKSYVLLLYSLKRYCLNMPTTVDELLHTFNHPPTWPNINSSISRKDWTRGYPDFGRNYAIHPPTIDAIDAFLGPNKDNPSGADSIGLQTPAYRLNTLLQYTESEGDVTRYFDQVIAPSLALAFSGGQALSFPSPDSMPVSCGPLLWPRSQVGPTALLSSLNTVDYQMVMHHSNRSLDLPAMIGEMKKPNTIIANEWNQRRPASAVTKTLQMELRA